MFAVFTREYCKTVP